MFAFMSRTRMVDKKIIQSILHPYGRRFHFGGNILGHPAHDFEHLCMGVVELSRISFMLFPLRLTHLGVVELAAQAAYLSR